MKDAIHPNYKAITVTCSCGNTFETRSTLTEDLQIEGARTVIRSTRASRRWWTRVAASIASARSTRRQPRPEPDLLAPDLGRL